MVRNWVKKYKEPIQWVLLWMLSLVGVQVIFGPDGKDWPSWVQALGSIVAIAASLRIAQVGFDKSEARHVEEDAKREAERKTLRRDAIAETERLALQLMLKASEAVLRLLSCMPTTSHVPNVALTAKGEFDAIAFGLRSLDYQLFDSYDKFEQCINVLGACLALSENTSDWGEKGRPSSWDRVTRDQNSQIQRSIERFRELTQLPPVERIHSLQIVAAYEAGQGPVVGTSHGTTERHSQSRD